MSIRELTHPGGAGPRAWVGSAAAAVAVFACAAVLGVLSVGDRTSAVLAGGALLMVGLMCIDLSLATVIAVPATLVMVRAGGFLSVSDVVLAAATAVAVLMISSAEARPMQPLIWLGIVYQACLIPTLVLNPYSANVIEWFHSGVLILGSLVVGWVIGREGHARMSLSLFVLGCCGIAIAAMVVAVQSYGKHGTFSPAYLPYLHKNLIGNSLAIALVIAYARPVWIGWTARWSAVAIVTCIGGIAASQSRQAIVAAVVGVLIVNLRPRLSTGRRSKLIWFALLPPAMFVTSAVTAQLQSGDEFNSVNQRLAWFSDSIDIWQTSPLFGVGLRWWYTDRFDVSFQPPNAEFEVLTSGGVVGLLGFLAMFSGAAWILTKLDPRYGTIALAVVITRFTQTQFDLYWVAGQASLLWLVAGIAFGVQARDLSVGLDAGPDPAARSSPDRPPTVRARPRGGQVQ